MSLQTSLSERLVSVSPLTESFVQDTIERKADEIERTKRAGILLDSASVQVMIDTALQKHVNLENSQAALNKRNTSAVAATKYEELFSSVIKTKHGDGWKVVNLEDDSNPHNFDCHWTLFKSTSGKTAEMCVHPFHDIVSNAVRKVSRWQDCDKLPEHWTNNIRKAEDRTLKSNSIYVEIGANIGTCVMEMLLSTDAPIVAFEPNPRNHFALRETIRQLDKSYQERVVVIPIALGDKRGSDKIYAANNNMGNSVVGMIIKDNAKQEFSEEFDIHIERLRDILEPGPEISLLKMDAQGYECRILEGFGYDLADQIVQIHFEVASKWQESQGCFDLFQRLHSYHFEIKRNNKVMTEADATKLGGVYDVDAIRID